jgi:hypothetical protein
LEALVLGQLKWEQFPSGPAGMEQDQVLEWFEQELALLEQGRRQLPLWRLMSLTCLLQLQQIY